MEAHFGAPAAKGSVDLAVLDDEGLPHAVGVLRVHGDPPGPFQKLQPLTFLLQGQRVLLVEAPRAEHGEPLGALRRELQHDELGLVPDEVFLRGLLLPLLLRQRLRLHGRGGLSLLLRLLRRLLPRPARLRLLDRGCRRRLLLHLYLALLRHLAALPLCHGPSLLHLLLRDVAHLGPVDLEAAPREATVRLAALRLLRHGRDKLALVLVHARGRQEVARRLLLVLLVPALDGRPHKRVRARLLARAPHEEPPH
mmetsp:Transcript_55076/g.160733  ORF Transcript_55076/g.160733 Transcript_55076/m.160733 type:complete len:253 (-) Transcript_55076:354-1112(-)